jgi:transcription elongation factor GreA
MTYVAEIRNKIAAREYNKVLVLWQEYCENDELDSEELIKILVLIKQSDFAKQFGQYVEAILPLVMTVQDEDLRFEILRHVYDLQTSNSQALYELAKDLAKTRFEKDPLFQEKLRLVGLRTKENFQGALSNFCLLNHIAKHNYVLHTAGWGVGEIVDFSFLREQVTIEFEHLGGCKRDISFKNAFRSLIPLQADHFYVLRFTDPEKLSTEAKEDPVKLITRILRDVGPQTTNEVKDLLADYVIDSASYSKWWQFARSRMKKDEHIEFPSSAKEPIRLRQEKITFSERLEKALQGKEEFNDVFTTVYMTVRDAPESAKKELSPKILEKVRELLTAEKMKDADRLQVYFFVENYIDSSLYASAIKDIVLGLTDVLKTCEHIPIVAFRKSLLQSVRSLRKDWEKIFAAALLAVEPGQIKDYLLKELLASSSTALVEDAVRQLLEHPIMHPEAFLWYFQKVEARDAPLMNTREFYEKFFEAFLILLHALERKKNEKELVKKMCSILTASRFSVVRELLKETSTVYAKEFLLLASKCHSLTAHDQKILQSLVSVVHGKEFEEKASEDTSTTIWTTEEGYRKAQERILQIGTVEVVENAREIEVARALGDLRENAEYKAALEKRSRLQSELRQLSEQFTQARIITAHDISTDCVGVGSKVTLKKETGKEASYIILGQWDADPEKNIISLQSKIAQNLVGKKRGNSFEFMGEPVTVTKIESYI